MLLTGCASRTRSTVGVQEQVRWLTPGLELAFEQCSSKPPASYSLHCFHYGQAPGWPYGHGFAVASTTTGAVLWIHLQHGDYPPHEVLWADFDSDGRQDIYFLAGEEDEFTTSVYLNRVVADRFGVSQFVVGYYNPDVYGLVVDFAADGFAELIIPERYAETDDLCASEFRNLEVNDRESRETYVRLAGRFEPFNMRFRREDEVPGLALFDRIEVVKLGNTSPPEAVREHLRWRVSKLKDAVKKVTPGCQDRVVRTIEHLELLMVGRP